MQGKGETRRDTRFHIWDAGREIHLHRGFHGITGAILGSITRRGRGTFRRKGSSGPRRIPGTSERFRMQGSFRRWWFRMQGILMHDGQRERGGRRKIQRGRCPIPVGGKGAI